ncbi:aminodeoxychorismate synthase component I [Williamsia deligens]|uniref:Aminodeoxychorismate synthase component I n=1 Tax=Williamsia deligens TaxID=321325 RepID=A0ABW3G8Y3_9NOCA|nr:aminodeoxychorismate synthase component I [Williamsia deligens]MCP2192491.1 para-aminobenzoate synthetase component 1 [Williamsia deligens]
MTVAESLGPGSSVDQVLGALADRARAHGVPGPAALVGDWLDAQAVIAPSIDVRSGHGMSEVPSGFWFGALSYPDRTDEARLPAVLGGTTDAVLVSRDGVWEFVATSGSRCPDDLRAIVSGTVATGQPRWASRWCAPDRRRHEDAITSCLDAIAAGEIYQACVCSRFTGHLDGDPLDFFRSGVAAMSPRKAAFLSGAWGAVASFSPETYLRRRGETVTSSPIKGTLPLTGDPAALRASVKDVAENVMIVDLVRNDLGRVAVPGSVTVPELLSVHPAPGVWHLVSTVAAQVPTSVDSDTLLQATFPPGSVTGTPKLAARSFLAGWESDARGVYCGAIGVRTAEGDLDLNVAIRTVEVAPDGATGLGVGGGITIDSDPALEWQECLDKAASIVALRDR